MPPARSVAPHQASPGGARPTPLLYKAALSGDFSVPEQTSRQEDKTMKLLHFVRQNTKQISTISIRSIKVAAASFLAITLEQAQSADAAQVPQYTQGPKTTPIPARRFVVQL